MDEYETTLRRTGSKARRWQKSLINQQLSVPGSLSLSGSCRASLASLDDLTASMAAAERSRSMCSIKLDTISLNMELFGGNIPEVVVKDQDSKEDSTDGVINKEILLLYMLFLLWDFESRSRTFFEEMIRDPFLI